MKNELNVVGYSEMGPSRGRALDLLFSDFMRERNLSLNAIDEIWESLTPEERNASIDTITTLRTRTFLAEDKPVQAYQTLVAAMNLCPTNLSLQMERSACLRACHEYLDRLFADDPLSPMIDILYNLLLKEAYINPVGQGRYLQYLSRTGKFAEAAKLALPLVALHPAMLGLRETVEEITPKFPHEDLLIYLATPMTALGRKTNSSSLTPQRARELMKEFVRLQEQIRVGDESALVSKALQDILGDLSELSPLDLTYKDFYLLKAIFDGNRGRNWDAVILLQNLIEADPCNLFYRRSREIEVQRFCETCVNKAAKADLKIDLVKAYAILREFTVVPYLFLKQVSLSELAAGNIGAAKARMDNVVALNPYDSDYLLAALDVAIESGDQNWMGDLLTALDRQKAERPWDLTAAAFATAA